jgi:hypothetical protein
MTRRLANAVLCFVYLSVILWIGASHHHGTVSGNDQCVACKWQHGTVGDLLPEPDLIAFTPAAVFPTRSIDFAPPSILLLVFQSRAPPVSSL